VPQWRPGAGHGGADRDGVLPRPQTAAGWEGFTAGFLMGGEAGVAWAYVCTQILPYYQ